MKKTFKVGDLVKCIEHKSHIMGKRDYNLEVGDYATVARYAWTSPGGFPYYRVYLQKECKIVFVCSKFWELVK